MISLLLAVCLLCEAFLLRFLWELGKASRDSHREGEYDIHRSRRSQTVPKPSRVDGNDMNLKSNFNQQSGRSTSARNRKSASLVMGAAFLALIIPLHAQEATGSAQSVSPDVLKKIDLLTKRVEQLEEQLKHYELGSLPREFRVQRRPHAGPIR